MKKPRAKVTLGSLLAILALAPLLAENPPPYLPGTLSPDPHPKGCIDCHQASVGGKDFRLNVAVELLPKHPDITRAFKNTQVPESCMICHKKGSALGSLATNLHRVHYGKLEKSRFVGEFGGSCLNCHRIDLDSGAILLKNGLANW